VMALVRFANVAFQTIPGNHPFTFPFFIVT